MKTMRIIGACFVTVFALSAITAASASAKLPQILFKEPAGGFPGTFTSVNLPAPKNVGRFETAGGTKIECTGQTDKGTIESAHLGKVEVKFTGCSTEVLGSKLECESSGAGKGNIAIPLEFHLGLEHTSTSTTVPALLLLLPGGLSGSFTFKCGGSLMTIVAKGNLNCLLTDLEGKEVVKEHAYTSLQLNCRQSKGKQNSTEFLLSLVAEGERLMTGGHLSWSLNGGTPEQAGQETEDALEKFENSKKEARNFEIVLEEE
jgi:hypothetical protein